MELGVGRPPVKPGGKRKSKRPQDRQPKEGGNCSSGDGECTSPSPGGGLGGESLFPKILTIERISGSQEDTESRGRTKPGPHSSSYVASRKQRFESVIKGSTHTPSAQPWNQVSIAPHTQTPLRSAYELPGLGPCVPPRCPTAGTSVVPLVPLVRYLGAWLHFPVHLDGSIRLGYAIQFTRHPPKFWSFNFTSVKAADAPVLCAEIAVILAKDATEPVPPADMKTGFYRPYFTVTKKGGGLRPILSWNGPFTSYRSICSCRASLNASVPEIGLQRSTWGTHTFMCRSFRATDHFCSLRFKDMHINTRSMTGSYYLSVRISCEKTGTWCSRTSAGWAFGSTWKRANSPDAEDHFSWYGVGFGQTDKHASRRNVLSQCWTVWICSKAGQRSHWNSFRGSWGIWQLQRLSRRSDCFIWDRFNTGSMAESRGGCGSVALTRP